MTDPLDVLRKSCQTNGLPTSGDKDVLLDRLLKVQGDKRKQPRKSSPVRKEDYVKKETAVLRKAGFDDENWIATEVARRWDKIKPSEPSANAGDISTLPVLLNPEQMATANLVLIGNEDGMYKYIKSRSKPAKASPKAAAKSEKKVVKLEVEPEESDSETKQKDNKQKAEEVEPEESDSETKQKDNKRKDNKRKAEENNEDDDYIFKFVLSRILKHAHKEEIAAMLVKFGVPALGSKTQMAEALAHQLTEETDEESE